MQTKNAFLLFINDVSFLAGVGFSAPGVSLNRLPGWEPHSYGYHGDDGMAFESCGTGKPYGPVFATGRLLFMEACACMLPACLKTSCHQTNVAKVTTAIHD